MVIMLTDKLFMILKNKTKVQSELNASFAPSPINNGKLTYLFTNKESPTCIIQPIINVIITVPSPFLK